MKIVLKKPVITEKAIARTKERYYTFEVDKKANKHQIKEAVEKLFNVTVEDVRTMTRPGKQRHVGKNRRLVSRSSTKRAIIRIGKDQTIGLFTTADTGADTDKKS